MSYAIKLRPDRMSDGSTDGKIQRIRDRGLPTLAAAKREIRSMAKHPNWPTGYFWIEDPYGVPIYGVWVREQPKTERVPTPARPHPSGSGHYEAGFTTRTVPGQVQRVLKAGNMPWNR